MQDEGIGRSNGSEQESQRIKGDAGGRDAPHRGEEKDEPVNGKSHSSIPSIDYVKLKRVELSQGFIHVIFSPRQARKVLGSCLSR